MTDAADSQQLDDLIGIAHRLGMAFGQAAENAELSDRKIELFNLFDRCFFSVRVGIALKLRLRKEMRLDHSPERPETERSETERLERPERADTLRYDERDRERETERASLPLLLRTLESVAADAAKLPGPPPAQLPTLRELLAQVQGAHPAPRTTRPALRARLNGSATTMPPPIYASPRPRRATGPP